MCCIGAGVQDCDFDRTIWPGASIDLMCQVQMNLFWRPLRDVCSVVATNAPRNADAPGNATGDRRSHSEIGLNEQDTRILRQRLYAIFNGGAVCHSQSEDWPGAELIEGSRVE